MRTTGECLSGVSQTVRVADARELLTIEPPAFGLVGNGKTMDASAGQIEGAASCCACATSRGCGNVAG